MGLARLYPFGSRKRKHIQYNGVVSGGTPPPVPTLGLQAEYLLATNSLDTSGNGRDMDTNTDISYAGGFAVFNGATSLMAYGTPFMATGTGNTISHTVKFNGVPGIGSNDTISFFTSGTLGATNLFHLYLANIGGTYFLKMSDGPDTVYTASYEFPSDPTGTTIHILCTSAGGYPNAVQNIYVNNVVATVGDSGSDGSRGYSYGLMVGSNPIDGAGQFASIEVSKLRIYDRVLDASEREALFIDSGVVPPPETIAFDSYSNGWGSTGTTHTFSHTTSGNNRILFVSILALDAADLVSGVTYGGVAMTRVGGAQLLIGTEWTYLYYIVAPTVGANDVVVTTSLSTTIFADSTSYTGAKQTAQPNDSTVNVITSVVGPQTSVTTTEDNCWLVGVFRANPETQTASAGTTFRGGVNTTIVIGDSNGPKTPVGTHSLGVTDSITNGIQIVAAFGPA